MVLHDKCFLPLVSDISETVGENQQKQCFFAWHLMEKHAVAGCNSVSFTVFATVKHNYGFYRASTFHFKFIFLCFFPPSFHVGWFQEKTEQTRIRKESRSKKQRKWQRIACFFARKKNTYIFIGIWKFLSWHHAEECFSIFLPSILKGIFVTDLVKTKVAKKKH